MIEEEQIQSLLTQMTIQEKIGQLQQLGMENTEEQRALVRAGCVGSMLNVSPGDGTTPAQAANALQRIAVTESRLGIPLIFGRDVIHGYRTIFPIPLGQAAAFDPQLVEEGARIAAREASACGIHWTFAPMVDVSRDPRWGRMAESGGEDSFVNAQLGAAMVRGFQGDDLSDTEHLAACAKHFVGYGATEDGRDYNTTDIPEGLLRDVYLPPFKACVDAGVATVMSAFNDLNGLPCSGNPFTLRHILKGEWGFNGFVVSDADAVLELINHGICADKRGAALAGVSAGVDMEMGSTCYAEFVQSLLAAGLLTMAQLDEAVSRILRIKFRLGLFEHPYVDEGRESVLCATPHLDAAKRAAAESCVLLKNTGVLPLPADMHTLAVIGPLADAPQAQLGCWAPDGRVENTVTPLTALSDALAGRCDVRYAPGVVDCCSMETSGFDEACRIAASSDAVVLFLGEHHKLSGELHSRAFLGFPGVQDELVRAVVACGKPVIVVVMAGRPLTVESTVEQVDAVLYAWHPGTMGGPALADLLLGTAVPSGKLPVSMPRTVGQVPIYYAHKHTGRPPLPDERVAPTGTLQQQHKNFASIYLDVDHRPLFPFGFGLSYTTFTYSDITLRSNTLHTGESLQATITVTNTGQFTACEVVQCYIRDLVGSVTRPVKELKGFVRVDLHPGEQRDVTFTIPMEQLAFHNAAMQRVLEPGTFQVMIGGNSDEVHVAEFELVANENA
ncbi:MAG TPA: glycoside hydrolase family 3 N-terminal domain-containing protein [Armatimonadota bacterium]|nr:glycoside hydrolase family 3 N-terminal domain-containing protein [Armatimonadota bacterium]